MMLVKQFLAPVLSCVLILVTIGCDLIANQEVRGSPPPVVQPGQATAEQLQQLVAPIALYPDKLVAEILAASTYPTAIVEANRWLQQNSSLKGAQLAREVDKQSWDPSVKALTEFPSVLANMDKNLSWTSTLGDAYFNQSQDVLRAVQVMRKRAQDAGSLKTTAQQTVTTKEQTIIIEPANPEIVCLPVYDPWIVYGTPLLAYPGYLDAGFFVGPGVWFSVGFPIGPWHSRYRWVWHNWGLNWRDRVVIYNHDLYVSRSHTFIDRRHGVRGGESLQGWHQQNFLSRVEGSRDGAIDHRADRGFVAPRVAPSGHPGAFSGFDHGGVVNQHSFRGQSSFGGGMHGGGDGIVHGGGGGHG